MPIPNAPRTAALPWLVALAGSFAAHVGVRHSPALLPCHQACHQACHELGAPAVDHTTVEHVIDRHAFDRLRADARQIATESADGLRLHGIRPGSLFAVLGFENGDLVVDISGGDATHFHVLRGPARRSIEIVFRIG